MSTRPEQIGNYIIDREIGRGATSEVWLATHAYMNHRQFAVKLLLSQNTESIQRFTREATLLSHLNHKNIVQIYDHGRYEHYYYSILQYIGGCSLQQFIDRKQRLDFPEALKIFTQIAQALDHAHSLQIVHRDVSPNNVLVEETTGEAYLTDFGIARDINQKITVEDKVMGTPGYWSPEHARSATEVTHLSDIYGLGVMLYTMLSGGLPWDDFPVTPDQPFGSLITLKQRGVYHVPNGVDRVIQTMLAIDPSKRFPSGQAAVDELERLSQKHRAATQNNGKPATVGEKRKLDTTNASAKFEAVGVQQNEVETVLGPDLIRAPIARAHERAEQLCQPRFVADLLDTWAKQGFAQGVFRRAMLGRMARLHRVISRNVYFYQLQVLYEERHDPEVIQEPDKEAENIPLEPEVDRWKVALPSVQIFQDDPGKQTMLPGSSRVVKCSKCQGQGKVTCSRCKGKRRIETTRQLSPELLSDPYGGGVRSSGGSGGGGGRSSSSGSGGGGGRSNSGNSGNSGGSGGGGNRSGSRSGSRGGSGKDQQSSQRRTNTGTGSTSNRQASSSSVPYSAVMQNPAGTLSTASVAPKPKTEKVLIPCPDCNGLGGHHCSMCDGTGRMLEHKAFRWERSTRMLTANDDLPSLDEEWLRQQFKPERIYSERVCHDVQSSDPPFRKEWEEIPIVQQLIEQAETETHTNRRIILSELTITMVPVTDVTFDMSKTFKQHETDLYELSIYGFENTIPKDWRLLNWERVLFVWSSVFLLILVVVFGFFAFI